MKNYGQWLNDGKPLDITNNGPKLSKEAAKSIVKVLLPRIVPDGKMKDHQSMKECVKWFGNIASGIPCAAEMKQVVEEYAAARSVAQTSRLF